MKTVTIEISDDCEVKIVKKEEKKEPVIRTYQDLITAEKSIKGYYIGTNGGLLPCTTIAREFDINIAASEKVAKSMLAMATISQLMPYYGGEITDEEWRNNLMIKYTIERVGNKIIIGSYANNFCFLAFHTKEQRDNFLKYNEQLVKDCLMID